MNLLFIIVFSYFACFGKEENRNGCLVLVFSCMLNMLLIPVCQEYVSPYLQLICATLDHLTAFLVLHFCRNAFGRLQAGLLFTSILVHWTCFYDLKHNTNVIYDHYDFVIAGITYIQMMVIPNGVYKRILYSRNSRDSGRIFDLPNMEIQEDSERCQPIQ